MNQRLLACTATILLALASCSSSGSRACANDFDCDTGETCFNSACQTVDAGAQQAIGGPCVESLQCQSGLFCALDGTGLTGGMCTESCNGGSCPSNTYCADLRATLVSGQVCAPMPVANTCRAGWAICATEGGACLPAGLCPATGVSASASGDLGQACTAGSCIAGESCRFGLDFPGGACSRACSATDASTCPANGACVVTDQGPLCLPTCQAATSTCRSGYSCSSLGTAQVCASAANGARACNGATPQIVSGGTAGLSSAPGFCVQPVATSTQPGSMVQEFGAHAVGDVVQFQVPTQIQSLSIVSQAIHARRVLSYGGPLDNTVVPTNVRSPGGNIIYQDGETPPADLSTATVYYASDSPGTGVLTLPNTTAGLAFADGGLPAGNWSFQVNDYAVECTNTDGCDGGASDGLYDVSVVMKPGLAGANGTIDVAFYLVGADGITSATAPGNANVLRMLSTLETLYQQAGICLGTITFYDVPAWAQAEFGTGLDADKSGPCDELSQMFTLAKAGNTLNFFLVGAISSTNAGGTVVGIDGTIPGPSTLGGTIHSGAAVSAADLSHGSCGGAIDFNNCGADVVAYIAAHEGGHWMGLYHTTEADGEYFDPLSDTPICSCESCTGSLAGNCGTTGSTTFVQASQCEGTTASCGGAQDLMFWLLDGPISKGTLSAQQGEVMRRNLLVQ